MFKFVHCVAITVGKRAVCIQLKCFLACDCVISNRPRIRNLNGSTNLSCKWTLRKIKPMVHDIGLAVSMKTITTNYMVERYSRGSKLHEACMAQFVLPHSEFYV